MKGQLPSSRETATRQGERTPARDVRHNRKFYVAAGDAPRMTCRSLRQTPSARLRRCASQLPDTSPLPLRTDDLYDQLLCYGLSPQELDRCGYPRLCPEKPGRILLMEWGEKAYSSRKTCSRCRASLVITHSGEYYAKSACFIHTGLCSAIGFSCCGASADHRGCKKLETSGRPRRWPSFAHFGGMAAPAKCTAVNWTAKCASLSAAFEMARVALLRLFNASAVFVAHGLENDLRALKLVHDRVAYTAVVFPHHRGLPYRRSLRSLVGDYVIRGVANGLLGHDSVANAKACMKLMLWKAVHDQKLRDRLSRWAGGWQRQPSE
ncbi:hypothetical protein HPB48_002756 [Haemaphysalis longicornis]|uniref:Exonuclease domain-containing protein n=1 Tax=Haemaphysalis longicornis TaxID=44386 RepID=A0A9J6GQI2_HAELO|nr:hypothetical protein HPB48_002756 [Haemaphysalis longicornis]